MSHVFVSYIREDLEYIERLHNALNLAGIEVWLDRQSLEPGTLWKEAIRHAIRTGAFFVACFSKRWREKGRSYMNEELILAIEELRQRPLDHAWFLPLKLTQCEVPDREIGGGLRLSDFQWLELYPNWEAGLTRLVDKIDPLLPDLAAHFKHLTSAFPKEREFAAQSIYEGMRAMPGQRRQRLLPPLLDHLYDSDANVTYYIVKALGQIHHEAALAALLKALDDPNWDGHEYKLAEVVEMIDPYNDVLRAYKERERNWDKRGEWIERKRNESDKNA